MTNFVEINTETVILIQIFFRDHIYLYQYQWAHPRTRLCILRGPQGETAPEDDDARNMKRIVLPLIVKSGCALPTDDS